MPKYSNKLDEKMRVVFPAKLRQDYSDVLYINYSLDEGLLVVYSEARFKSIKKQIDDMPSSKKTRLIRRMIVGNASRCELDSQGRISLQENLIDYVGIAPGEQVNFLDMGGTLEICSTDYLKKDMLESIKDIDIDELDIVGI